MAQDSGRCRAAVTAVMNFQIPASQSSLKQFLKPLK
jgi:hypothetical protein